MNKELSMCISRALSFTKVHLLNFRGVAGDESYGSLLVLLLSCTSCSALLIIIIMRSPGVCLDEQGTE